MQADPTLRLTIEGHTCNIGTAEYNLALGERRAKAVRDYLVEPRHLRRPAAHGQLRRRAAEVRQLARRDAPAEPPRRARRPSAVGGSSESAMVGVRRSTDVLRRALDRSRANHQDDTKNRIRVAYRKTTATRRARIRYRRAGTASHAAGPDASAAGKVTLESASLRVLRVFGQDHLRRADHGARALGAVVCQF